MSSLTKAASVGGSTLTTFGVITLVLGIMAMLAPAVAGLSIAMLLGFVVTCAGIIRMMWAIRASKGFTAIALGSLTIIGGIVLFANPVIGAAMLTTILTLYFIIDGIVEIAAGLGAGGGIWMVVGGVLSIVLGCMLWAQYPLSGAWALGLLLGIKLFSIGMAMIRGGSTLRSFANA